MALTFDEEGLEEPEEDETNEYLSDPDKAMSLLRSIFAKGDADGVDDATEQIDDNLKPLLFDLSADTQRSAVYALNHMKSQIAQMRKVRLLEGKAVLGIGGKFSAGKSCFINSLTGAGLPEGQQATTSIATYIVKADKKSNVALTTRNRSVALDDMAIEALTHEFSRKYNIGFSRLIESLAIYSPDFHYPNIAILDTPGYSKSDLGKSEDTADAEIARAQLGAADYLIWLMDIESGVISENDLNFLRTLNMETDILFIFNKAGLVPEERAMKVLVETKNILKLFEKSAYNVIAYDSREERTVIGEGSLERFLDEINRSTGADARIFERQIRRIWKEVESELSGEQTDLERWLPKVRRAVSTAKKTESLPPLIDEYREREARLRRLKRTKACFSSSCDELSRHLRWMQGAD